MGDRMTTLYYVPIEPLPERYTVSWYKNFPKAFHKNGFDVEVIDGDQVSSEVVTGTFLDINNTIIYKSSQLAKIAKMFENKQVKPYSYFFFADVEFWGLESVRLLSQMNKIPIIMVGFLHAASYTIEDAFAVAAPYQQYTELGWLAACDKVFVGSWYHQKAVIERRMKNLPAKERESLESRLEVIPNPLFKEDYQEFDEPKQDKIILPNRFDWEKRPNLSLQFAYLAKKAIPDLEVVVTTSRKTFRSNKTWLTTLAREMEKDGIIKIKEGLTKEEYHREMATSKVMLSNSIEENFGYCIAEALYYNTFPLLNMVGSHPEMVRGDAKMLFTDEDQVVDSIKSLLMLPKPSLRHMLKKSFDSIDTMCESMVSMVLPSRSWY